MMYLMVTNNLSINVIILSPEEEVLMWLHQDEIDITEINTVNKVRRIKVTYPLETELYEEERPWFAQGNKIFIPSTLGLDNCLYIINTDYEVDLWDKNKISFEAEEVLTELNYQVVGVYSSSSITIDKKQLETWFGKFYDIGDIEELSSNKKTIQALGITTLMNLLRNIEEKTERVFVTEYTYKNNIISRKLHLKKEISLRNVARTEYLDCNYNLDSLILKVDEENTFSAMAPLMKINNETNTSTSGYVNANDSRTSYNATPTADSEAIYNAWKNYEVQVRQEIPMMVEKQSDGSVIYSDTTWYAPFEKRKGDIFISSVQYSNANYQSLFTPITSTNKRANPLPKIGTVDTSETDKVAIYNTLANALLDKLYPKFEISIKVKDIQQILGVNNLGYHIYETLYVKIPGFDYWVPAYITETQKNPHLAGNDSIKIETDVKGTHEQIPTEILSDSIIAPANIKTVNIGGILVDNKGNPVANQVISINIKLQETYDKNKTAPTPEIKVFNPESEKYYFTESEVLKIEKTLRNALINRQTVTEMILQDIRGNIYSVPRLWLDSILSAYLQWYINSDDPLGRGKFPSVIPVHYDPDAKQKIQSKNNLEYYASIFTENQKLINQKLSGKISSNVIQLSNPSEKQSTGTCVAASISNLSMFLYNHITEKEVVNELGVGLYDTDISKKVIPTLEKLGYKITVKQFTRENVQQYITEGTGGLLFVNSRKMGYSNEGGHAMTLNGYYYENGIQNMECCVYDSNKPVTDPLSSGQYVADEEISVPFRTLENAISITFKDGEFSERSATETPYIIFVSLTDKQLSQIEVEETQVSEEIKADFRPDITSYTFNSTEIERVYKKVRTDRIKFPLNSKYNNGAFNSSMIYDVISTDGIPYKMQAYWVYALVHAYCYFYRGHWEDKAQSNLIADNNGLAHQYSDILETRRYASPYYPEKQEYANNYTLSTILYSLGIVEPPKTVFNGTGVNGSGTAPLTYSQWATAIKHYLPSINCYILEGTIRNIFKYGYKRYPRVYFLCFTDKTHKIGHRPFTEFSVTKQPYYPILITNADVDEEGRGVHVVCPLSNGASPTNTIIGWDDTFYETYLQTEIDLDDTFNAPPTAGNSDYKNKMLLISYYSLEELDTEIDLNL